MKGQTYVILAIIMMILVAIFALTNVNTVEVTYFFWKVDSPLILVILFSLLMGGIITVASGMVKFFTLQRENKQLRAENDRLQQLVEENEFIASNENKDVENEKL